MGKNLEEQKRLSGIKGNLEETVVSMKENREIRRASRAMGIQLVKALKGRGIDAEKLNTDGWGHTPVMVSTPYGRFTAYLIVQDAFPGKQQIAVTLQDPTFADREHKRDILRVLQGTFGAFNQISTKFGEFGSVKVDQNAKHWPQIWVEVPEDRWQDALKKAPKLMGSVAAAIVKGLKR